MQPTYTAGAITTIKGGTTPIKTSAAVRAGVAR